MREESCVSDGARIRKKDKSFACKNQRALGKYLVERLDRRDTEFNRGDRERAFLSASKWVCFLTKEEG